MNHEGRVILYRVMLRLHEDWGIAVAREAPYNSAPQLATQPFEVDSIFSALRIVKGLHEGKVEMRNGKSGK